MGRLEQLSIYISYLLRHHPEAVGLEMDEHGWVFVEQLIEKINDEQKYSIDIDTLDIIVTTDKKGRYRYDDKKNKIKACQGHSIGWVKPELDYMNPPEFLYHGTTTDALKKIMESGEISRMSRHAVHMQENKNAAWKSAIRWKKNPVVLKIAAKEYSKTGAVFGKTENDVWCTECVPLEYIVEKIYEVLS